MEVIEEALLSAKSAFFAPKNHPTSKPESRVKSRVKIMELIASQPNITMPEMAAKTKLTLKAIEKQISLLKEEGRLRREGPTHGGHWVVVTPEQPANNKPTKQH